jgi:hypothetical protein
MTNSRAVRRVAIAAAVVAGAVGAASPAQASDPNHAEKCDVRLERLEAQFRMMEEQHGWEEAAEWWQPRWKAYFQSCIV